MSLTIQEKSKSEWRPVHLIGLKHIAANRGIKEKSRRK
jgi:hypothetical protein